MYRVYIYNAETGKQIATDFLTESYVEERFGVTDPIEWVNIWETSFASRNGYCVETELFFEWSDANGTLF